MSPISDVSGMLYVHPSVTSELKMYDTCLKVFYPAGDLQNFGGKRGKNAGSWPVP